MALIATKVSTAAADNLRLMKGKYVSSADGSGDYVVFDLPRKAYIDYLALDVKTGFSVGSTGVVTLGTKEPATTIAPSRLADNLVTLPETTGVKVIPVGVYLENGGALVMRVTKGNSSTDFAGRVFVKFTVIH